MLWPPLLREKRRLAFLDQLRLQRVRFWAARREILIRLWQTRQKNDQSLILQLHVHFGQILGQTERHDCLFCGC